MPGPSALILLQESHASWVPSALPVQAPVNVPAGGEDGDKWYLRLFLSFSVLRVGWVVVLVVVWLVVGSRGSKEA